MEKTKTCVRQGTVGRSRTKEEGTHRRHRARLGYSWLDNGNLGRAEDVIKAAGRGATDAAPLEEEMF